MSQKNSYRWLDSDPAVMIRTESIFGLWMAVLGCEGMGLYMFYKALSQNGLTTSFKETMNHLGIGQKKLYCYHALLEWANVLQVTVGDNRTPNQYELYSLKPLSETDLERLSALVRSQEPFTKSYNQSFQRVILRRLNSAKPFGLVSRVGTGQTEIDTTVGEARDALKEMGHEANEVREYLSNYSADRILDWHHYIYHGSVEPIGNPRGYLKKVISQQPPTPRPKKNSYQTVPERYRDIIQD